MDSISANTVEKTYTRIYNMSEQEAFRLSYQMEKEQPLLVAYLAAVDNELLNQEERELLFYLVTVVWQIMCAGEQPLPEITEDSLLKIEEGNMKIAKSLQGANTISFAEVIKSILKDCYQPEVFRYVVTALMEEDSESIRDENLGIIMLDLKTVIDCFDR